MIPCRIKPMILKLVFTASLLDLQHQKDNMENKAASLRVVPLRKALNEIPSSWSGRDRWPAIPKLVIAV